MIFLSKEALWISPSAIARIGNPEYVCALRSPDGKQVMLRAAEPSAPHAAKAPHASNSHDQDWLIMKSPQAARPVAILPDYTLLEAHGIQLDPATLLFDMEDAITRSLTDIFVGKEIVAKEAPSSDGKQTSSFPPERWIHELNRMFPSLWTDLRKALADPRKILKGAAMELLDGLPDSCRMPTFFPYMALVSRLGQGVYTTYRDVVMTIASMYIWRMGKGVYRFAPELYDALISQPFTADIPNECLFRLPEWAVYIETPGISIGNQAVDGFIAHLDYNIYSGDTDLQFAIFRYGVAQPKMLALPLGEGGLIEALKRVEAIDSMFDVPSNGQPGIREEYKSAVSAMLQLLLYLCSEEPDMPAIEHPRHRQTLSGGVRCPAEPQTWDVGVRIAAALRRASAFTEESEISEHRVGGTHARPRPHIRCAHWATYWTGPRSGSQTPILRWIPPLPINMDWKTPTPTVVRPVAAG